MMATKPFKNINTWNVDIFNKLLFGLALTLFAYYLIDADDNFLYDLIIVILAFTSFSIMVIKVLYSYDSFIINSDNVIIPRTIIQKYILRKKQETIKLNEINYINYLLPSKTKLNDLFPLSGFIIHWNRGKTYIHINMNTIENYNQYEKYLKEFFIINGIKVLDVIVTESFFTKKAMKKTESITIGSINIFIFLLWLIILFITSQYYLSGYNSFFLVTLGVQSVLAVEMVVLWRILSVVSKC